MTAWTRAQQAQRAQRAQRRARPTPPRPHSRCPSSPNSWPRHPPSASTIQPQALNRRRQTRLLSPHMAASLGAPHLASMAAYSRHPIARSHARWGPAVQPCFARAASCMPGSTAGMELEQCGTAHAPQIWEGKVSGGRTESLEVSQRSNALKSAITCLPHSVLLNTQAGPMPLAVSQLAGPRPTLSRLATPDQPLELPDPIAPHKKAQTKTPPQPFLNFDAAFTGHGGPHGAAVGCWLYKCKATAWH